MAAKLRSATFTLGWRCLVLAFYARKLTADAALDANTAMAAIMMMAPFWDLACSLRALAAKHSRRSLAKSHSHPCYSLPEIAEIRRFTMSHLRLARRIASLHLSFQRIQISTWEPED